jgi:hypothetical protein
MNKRTTSTRFYTPDVLFTGDQLFLSSKTNLCDATIVW